MKETEKQKEPVLCDSTYVKETESRLMIAGSWERVGVRAVTA